VSVTPIRPGVEPTLDAQREMEEVAISAIRDAKDAYGALSSIAVVVTTDGGQAIIAICGPGEGAPSNSHTAARAAALLLRRAAD